MNGYEIVTSSDYARVLAERLSDGVRADRAQRGETVRTSDVTSAVQRLAFTPGGVVGRPIREKAARCSYSDNLRGRC